MNKECKELIKENLRTQNPYLDLGHCRLDGTEPELKLLASCHHIETLIFSNVWREYDEVKQKWLEKKSQNRGEKNQLTQIPPYLPTQIKKMVLDGERGWFNFFKIQDYSFLAELKQLQSLNLIFNQIQDYSFLAELKQLQHLYLCGNQIQDISFLAELKQLQSLYLDTNKIQDISFLAELKQLQILNLRWNQIQDISFLAELKQLQHLYLCENQIQDISFLAELKQLQHLYLCGNQIQDYSFLAELKQLQTLDLRKNKVQDISFLAELMQLNHLDLSENQIQDYSFLAGLKQLKSLDLSENQIQDYSFLTELEQLQSLNLRENKIEDYSFLAKLKQLQSLDLRENKIEDYSFLAKLEQLQSLDLRENKIEDISQVQVILNLPLLRELQLYNNPIEDIFPKGVIVTNENNLVSLRQYFQSLEKGEVKNDEIKWVLVGNTTAGKSSLLDWCQEREYEIRKDSTHGVKQVSKSINNNLKVNIWDFGGQEYYHTTHQLFLSNNAVYGLVWEADTNQNGVRSTKIYLRQNGKLTKETINLEHFDYQYWLDSIRYYAPKSPILLIQNKLDLPPQEPEFPNKDIREKYGLNINDIFAISIKKAAEQDKKFEQKYEEFEKYLIETLVKTAAQYPIGIYWVLTRNRMRKLAENQVQLTRKKYEKECRLIDKTIELETLTTWLHETGVVLYYPYIQELKKKVFIRPTWVTENIYRILDYTVQQNKGEFDFTHVKAVLKGTKAKSKEFIALMKAFELIFQIRDTNQFVAPQYLPKECVEKGRLEDAFYHIGFEPNNPNFDYTIYYPNFLPKSIISRFIARYGIYADRKFYWKYGIYFAKNQIGAYVECKWDDKKINIKVQNQATWLQKEIFDTLQVINEQNKNIEISINGEDFEKLEHIKKYAQNGKLITQNKTMDFSFIFYNPNENDTMSLQLENIKNLLSQDKINQAIEELLKITKRTEFEEQVILQSGRLKRYEKEYNLEEMTQENFGVNRTRICKALLYIISEMPDNQISAIPKLNQLEKDVAEIKILLQKVDKKIPDDLKEILQTILLQLNEKDVQYIQSFYTEMRKLSLEQLEAIEELIWQTLEDLRTDNQEVKQLLQKAETDRLQTKAKLELGLPYLFKIESEYPMNQGIKSFWTKFNNLIPQNLKRNS